MRDNKSSQPAQKYDASITKTIPFYTVLIEQTIDLVKKACPDPVKWLDTGCGTGNLIEKALQEFSCADYILADPSKEMLEICRDKFAGQSGVSFEYIEAGTEELRCPESSFDVITAVLAHHYFDKETRKIATENCLRMLKPGGVYVTIESIRPQTEKGFAIGLERWRSAQLSRGKEPAEVDKHLSRYDVEIFPITIEAHIQLLKDAGFSSVEVFWVSVMQAGFYAIK